MDAALLDSLIGQPYWTTLFHIRDNMYVLTYSTDESGSTYAQFRITRVLPGNKSRFMQGIGVCPTRTKNLEWYLTYIQFNCTSISSRRQYKSMYISLKVIKSQ